MVTHRNRRGDPPPGDHRCLDCGTPYLFTTTYRGNYCPDCRAAWIARQSAAPPRRGSRARRHRPHEGDVADPGATVEDEADSATDEADSATDEADPATDEADPATDEGPKRGQSDGEHAREE